MDKKAIKTTIATALRGAVASVAVAAVSQALRDVEVGDKKIVMFTAKK
jgi:hypothetical protein